MKLNSRRARGNTAGSRRTYEHRRDVQAARARGGTPPTRDSWNTVRQQCDSGPTRDARIILTARPPSCKTLIFRLGARRKSAPRARGPALRHERGINVEAWPASRATLGGSHVKQSGACSAEWGATRPMGRGAPVLGMCGRHWRARPRRSARTKHWQNNCAASKVVEVISVAGRLPP